jgi:hypothetical protein
MAIQAITRRRNRPVEQPEELEPEERKQTTLEVAETIQDLLRWVENPDLSEDERAAANGEIARLLEQDLPAKVGGICWVDRKLESAIADVQREQAILQAHAVSLAQRRVRLRDYMWLVLNKLQIESVSCRGHSITISAGSKSVAEPVDTGLLPLEYFHCLKPPRLEPDKDKIKRDIVAGIDVPGASLRQGQDKVTIR